MLWHTHSARNIVATTYYIMQGIVKMRWQYQVGINIVLTFNFEFYCSSFSRFGPRSALLKTHGRLQIAPRRADGGCGGQTAAASALLPIWTKQRDTRAGGREARGVWRVAYKYAARGVRGQSVSCPQHSRYIQHHEAPGECRGLEVTSGLIVNISVFSPSSWPCPACSRVSCSRPPRPPPPRPPPRRPRPSRVSSSPSCSSSRVSKRENKPAGYICQYYYFQATWWASTSTATPTPGAPTPATRSTTRPSSTVERRRGSAQ